MLTILRPVPGPALIGAAGAGLIGSAILPTDPVSGYPPGTPGVPRAPSRAGTVHNLAAIPVFLGLSAAAASASWRSFCIGQRGWGSIALAPPSPCRRPWCWPLRASANHHVLCGWADCSSAPAS